MSTRLLAGNFFIFFSLIPWVSFGLNTMDSQPWPVLTASVFLYFSVLNSRINKVLLNLFWIVPVFLVAALVSQNELGFSFGRAGFAYIGMPLVIIAYWYYFKDYGFPLKIFIIVNILYLLVGVLQLLFGGEITSAFVNMRTTADRGVTSLAAEPTFFAIFLFFISWIYLIVSNYKPSKLLSILLVINLFALVFVAKSSMGILFSIVGGAVYLVSKFGVKQVILFSLLILVSFLAGSWLMSDTRVSRIITMVSDVGLLGVIRADASINVRVADVILPIQGAFANNLLPGGFNSYGEASMRLRELYNGFFWYGGGSDTIMSYAGAFIYELGLFGLLYLIMLGCLAIDGSKKRTIELFLLALFANSAISVGFTLIPAILALMFVVKYSSIHVDTKLHQSLS